MSFAQRLDDNGFNRLIGAMGADELMALKRMIEPLGDAAGHRLANRTDLADFLRGTRVAKMVQSILGHEAMPVRALLFNKSLGLNWALGWHQDRTITVRRRSDVPGFGPWTVKRGIAHVEPPFSLIEAMVTVRIHVDDVDEHNAPLKVAPGSHKLGKIAEAEYGAVVEHCGIETCFADAGDAWFYRTAILHASDAAQEGRQRRVLQIDFCAEELPTPLEWLGIN